MIITSAHSFPFNTDKQSVPPASEEHPDPPNSWFATWATKANNAIWKHTELQADAYPIWLREFPSIDMGSVHHKPYYLPIGWTDPTLPNGEEIGRLMGLNMIVRVR